MTKTSPAIIFLLILCFLAACETAPSSEGAVSPSTLINADVLETAQASNIAATPDSPMISETPETAGTPQTSEPADTPETSEVSAPKYSSISDFIPDIDSVEKLAVYAGPGYTPLNLVNSAYAIANADEQDRIMEFLNSYDFSEFVEGTPDGIAVGHELRIKTSSDTYYLSVSYSEESDCSFFIARYNVVKQTAYSDDRESVILSAPSVEMFLQCPGDVFSIENFRQTADGVLTNSGDPDYSGTMTQSGSNETISINKRSSAIARHILDGAIENAGSTEAFEGVDYDVAFAVGETTYMLSSGSAQFSRQTEDGILYAELDDSWLRKVSFNLHFLVGTANP